MKTNLCVTMGLWALCGALAMAQAPAGPKGAEKTPGGPGLDAKNEAVRQRWIADLKAHGFPSKVVIKRIGNNGALGEIETRVQDPETGNMMEFPSAYVLGLGKPQGLVDGNVWTGTLYLAGTYQFKSAYAGERTVRRFALTPETAVDVQIAEKVAEEAKAGKK